MQLASKIDPHGMTASDSLKNDLHDIILKEKPSKIIETGTFLGTGTTFAMLNALKLIPDHNYKIISIEANPNFYYQAVKNLRTYIDMGVVEIHNGISIPYSLLPGIIDDDFPEEIITDFMDSKEYLNEVAFKVPSKQLMFALQKFNDMPDLVVLDSAGHLGTIEFDYLMTMVQGSFILILDDTLHRKHYKTLLKIKADSRFEILKESTDKFGYALVKYNHSMY